MTPDTDLLADVRDLKVRLNCAERRARLSAACAVAALALTALLNLRPAALAVAAVPISPGVSLASLVARLTAVEAKTAPIATTGNATSGYLLTITKANVQIVDGTGYTDDGQSENGLDELVTPSGLGNLIIGYGGGSLTTGAHNLVVGNGNSYSNYGGFVAGNGNYVSGEYASVSGGQSNEANGDDSSVSGGASSQANSQDASVAGGIGNYAESYASTISGGFGNLITGDNGFYSTISGGEGLLVTTQVTWAAGGDYTPAPPIGDGTGGSGTYHSP